MALFWERCIVGLVRPHVRSSWGIVGAAIVGGAGFERERERGFLRHCDRLRPCGGPLHECVGSLQQQAATPQVFAFAGKGFRTGGRPHPGLAGARDGLGGLVVVGPSAKSILGLGSEVVRIVFFCVLTCPPVLPLLGVLLLAFCLAFCVFAALGGFAPVAHTGLGPLAFSLHDPGHPV